MKHSYHPWFLAAALALGTVALGAVATGCDDSDDNGTTSAPSATTYSAALTGADEVPAVTTTATGQATATLSPQATSLTLTANWSGLSGDATGAHIHRGAKGVAGPVIKPLTISGTSATVTWSTTDATQAMTAADVADLKAGNLYVNVHTAQNPGGEIRGQLAAQKAPTSSGTPGTGTTGNPSGGY